MPQAIVSPTFRTYFTFWTTMVAGTEQRRKNGGVDEKYIL